MKKYDTLVLIGRFQPVHNAHVEIIRRATQLADRLIIIVGSVELPSTYKNPFNFGQRQAMIEHAIYGIVDPTCTIRIESQKDYLYNDQAWIVGVQNIVAKYNPQGKVGIIGHDKGDNHSSTFAMFPQWDHEDVDLIEPLNATNIRDLYFRKDVNMSYIKNVVPVGTFNFLSNFRQSLDKNGDNKWNKIVSGRDFIASYKKQYASLPYEPVFVTTDAVVIQSGHVLMIKRKSEPGKGLWAMPGGFLNASTDKSVVDAAIRELKEETGIKVPVPVLLGSIKDSKVFDAIDRSERGRTITHAFKIVLPDGELPKVKGADDAEKAKWVPLSELYSEDCFEDHYEIIQHFVGT